MLVVLFVELVDVNFKRLNPFCPPGSGLGDKSTQLRGSVWRGLCVAESALPPGRWLGAERLLGLCFEINSSLDWFVVVT